MQIDIRIFAATWQCQSHWHDTNMSVVPASLPTLRRAFQALR